MTASDRIARATAKLLLARPWWASLLLHLRPASNNNIPTAATDGRHIFYNENFVNKLPAEELEGVLCHEVGHCALLYFARRGHRDPLLFNIAHDACVNALLEADGIHLPQGSVPAAHLDKTAEELYDEWKRNGGAPREWARDCLESGDGDAEEEGLTEEALTEKWTQAVAQAHGLAPQTIARRVADNAGPRLRPEDVLAEFVTRHIRSDRRTWTRPSRRTPGQAPGWNREPATNLALVIDTSGSMTDGVLAPILATVRTFLAAQGVVAYVIAADASIGAIVTPGEPLPNALPGGGGTDFRPALARCEALDVAAIVYFTDGYGAFPAGCEKPVLWALTHRNIQPPFGAVVYID